MDADNAMDDFVQMLRDFRKDGLKLLESPDITEEARTELRELVNTCERLIYNAMCERMAAERSVVNR